MPINSRERDKSPSFHLKSEAVWVFIGQAGIAVGSFLGIKIFTNFLSPYEFGRFALANTVIALIGTNLFGPFGQGVMRFWSISQQKNEIHDFMNTVKRGSKFLLYGSLFFGFALSVFSIFEKKANWSILFSTALFVGAATGWYGVRLSILMAARRRNIVAAINSGASILKPVFASVLIILVYSSTISIMIGYFVIVCIFAFITDYYVRRVVASESDSFCRNENSSKNIYLNREIVRFSMPFFAWSMFSWIYQSCDRWALQAYHTSDIVGSFFVISQLAVYPLVFGSYFLSNLFIPIAYERAGNLKSKSSIKSANKIIFSMILLYILGACALILIFSVFHETLVRLISDTKYVTISYLLPGLTLSWALFYLGQMLSSFGMLANIPHVYILPIGVSGVTAAFSTFFLSSKIGPIGVVWGLGIAGIVYAFWCLVISKKILRMKGSVER